MQFPLRAQEASAPVFALHTADGIVASGPLQQVREDWSISLSGNTPVQASGKDVVALRRTQTPLPPGPSGEHVVLANGDKIPGTVLELSNERLRVQARLGAEQELTLPLSTVARLWFATVEDAVGGDLVRQRLEAKRRKNDLVLLRNGDIVEGTLTALSAEAVHIDHADGKAGQIGRDRIAAVALSTELARSFRAKGVYGRLILANGGRISLLSAHNDGQTLVGKTVFGSAIQVPIKEIVALDLRQGRAVYLSDLKPLRYEHTPYLGVRWPYTMDQSVAGNDLRVAGSTYDKGVGMHSQSRLTFALDGGYQWFEARVGLDDRTGREGSVAIEVRVDDKAADLGTVRELTGHDKALPVRVPVAGAREITLVVLFGRHGDVQDHVDWADARLIK